ncbi:SDR family oxidoreductase [Bradyrhizobium sp. 1.29L]
MSFSLRGKTALVTAASEGLGLASAIKIASAGARVAISGRDTTKLAKAKKVIDAASGNGSTIAIAADLTKAADTERLVAETLRQFDSLDILVINSGHVRSGTVEDLDDLDWYQAFDLLLMSAVRLTRLVVPHMRKRKIGDIAYITASRVREPNELILSNAFRAGVSSLAKTLSHAVGGDNIRVNVLAPGPFNTAQLIRRINEKALAEKTSHSEAARRMTSHIPLERFGEVEEFGALVAFVVSREAAYLTGSTIVMDGGIGRYAF